MNKYVITYQNNSKLNKIVLNATSQNQLYKHSDLPNNIIKIKKKQSLFFFLSNFQIDININQKEKTLKLFEQLQTMLEANLTFNSAITLLLKNQKDKNLKKLLNNFQFCIKNNLSFSKYLKNESLLDKTSLLFLDLGLKNGNIKDAVDSLITIQKEIYDSKKDLKKTLQYPMFLIFALIVALVLILNFVLPNFEHIFSTVKTELPLSTVSLLKFKEFIVSYYIYIFSSIAFFSFLCIIFYKKSTYWFDKLFYKHSGILKKLFKSYIYYKLFLSIYTIVKAKYKFQTALNHSVGIIDNLYIKSKVQTVINDINKGTTIPKAFFKSSLFEDITIELLYTAEYSNNYEKVLKDITIFYKKRFKESIENFSSIIEPMLIIAISLVVLWIVLAVMVPVWDLSSSL